MYTYCIYDLELCAPSNIPILFQYLTHPSASADPIGSNFAIVELTLRALSVLKDVIPPLSTSVLPEVRISASALERTRKNSRSLIAGCRRTRYEERRCKGRVEEDTYDRFQVIFGGLGGSLIQSRKPFIEWNYRKFIRNGLFR